MYGTLLYDAVDHPFGYGFKHRGDVDGFPVDSGILVTIFTLGWLEACFLVLEFSLFALGCAGQLIDLIPSRLRPVESSSRCLPSSLTAMFSRTSPVQCSGCLQVCVWPPVRIAVSNRFKAKMKRGPKALAILEAMPAPGSPSAPFRVLYFDHTAMLGGGEIALLNLVRYVDRQRITPIVVLCAEGPLAERLRALCEVHILPLSERVRTVKKDSVGWRSLLKLRDFGVVLNSSFKLARFAVKHDINLIHTNSLKADIIGGLAGQLARLPVVWHVRDRIESDYLPKSTTRAFRLLARFLPSYVIANSEAVLKTLCLKPTRFQAAIPSGVDLAGRAEVVRDAIPDELRRTASAAGSKQVVALIGRISPWKGQHIFLQAAAIVRRRFPSATFKIIGTALFGEQQYEAEVRRLCTELGLDGSVEFTGFCSNIPETIAGLDLVVHASTIGEPFGQVIVEGMAAGKPVVATNGGGVPEIVADKVTGFLVPMGDATAMAEAICKVLSDPLMARRMGLQGFARVKELFTIEGTAKKVGAVYRQILEAI